MFIRNREGSLNHTKDPIIVAEGMLEDLGCCRFELGLLFQGNLYHKATFQVILLP